MRKNIMFSRVAENRWDLRAQIKSLAFPMHSTQIENMIYGIISSLRYHWE